MAEERTRPSVQDILDETGAMSLPYRELIWILLHGPVTIDEMVSGTGLSRRSVETLLRAAEADIVRSGQTYRLPDGQRSPYRAMTPHQRTLSDEEAAEFEDELADIIDRVPRPVRHLDHVQATARTVVRRAMWLENNYYLTGRDVMFIGDHDLTSIALAMINPTVTISTVDIDDSLLSYLESHYERLSISYKLRYADLRNGLPDDLNDTADIFVTDPPYTPFGMQLFVGRGIEALRSTTYGQGCVAYGFGDRTPTLGLRVQQALSALDLVYCAILPGFNSYKGAQAIGSASDWYVLQPTPKTKPIWERKQQKIPQEIYTHGLSSVESVERPDWKAGGRSTTQQVLQDKLGEGADISAATVSDLTRESDSVLYRKLLDGKDPQALVVASTHPDVRTRRDANNLVAAFSGKYAIDIVCDCPAPRFTTVIAIPTPLPDCHCLADHVRRAITAMPKSTVRVALAEGIRKSLRAVSADTVPSNRDIKTLLDNEETLRPLMSARVDALPRPVIERVVTTATHIARDLHEAIPAFPSDPDPVFDGPEPVN